MAEAAAANKEIEPETEANGPAAQDEQQQQQPKGIGQRIRDLLWRKDQSQKERPDDAVKLGCGGLFRRKKHQRADAGETGQKPTEKPKKSKGIKGGTVKEEEEQQQNTNSDSPATVPKVSTEEQPASTAAPAGSEKPPRPLVDLVPSSAKKEIQDEKAADEKAADEKAENGASGSEDESEKERRAAAAERKFQETSVDMSKVAVQPGVKVEQGPQSDMWSGIINKSFIGTGIFKRAAVCSLESGAVLACNPEDFTPTVEQVAALRENFATRSAFSAAGFGLADTVYSLVEEAGRQDILFGEDQSRGQTVLVCKTNTALLAAACEGAPDRAADMLADMRQHFVSQGM